MFVAFVLPVLHQHRRGHIIKLPTADALFVDTDNADDYYYDDDEVGVGFGVPPAPQPCQQRLKHLNGRAGNLLSPRANKVHADDAAAAAADTAAGDGNVAVGISSHDAVVAGAEGTAHPLGWPVRWPPAPMQSYHVRADDDATSANAHRVQQQQQQQQSNDDDQLVNRTDDAHNLDVAHDDAAVDGGTDVIGDGINAGGVGVDGDAEFTQYDDGSSRIGAASTLTGFDGGASINAGNAIISNDDVVDVPTSSSSLAVGPSMTDGLLLAALQAGDVVSSPVLDSAANGFSTLPYGIDVQTGDNESVNGGVDADADAEWPPNGGDNIVAANLGDGIPTMRDSGDGSDMGNRMQIRTSHMARLPDAADTIEQFHSNGMHMNVDDNAVGFDSQRLGWVNNPDADESQRYGSDITDSGEELAKQAIEVGSSEYGNEQFSSRVDRRTDDNQSSSIDGLVSAVKSGVDQFGNLLNSIGSMGGSALGLFGNINVQSKNQSAERRTDEQATYQSDDSDNTNAFAGAAVGPDAIDSNPQNAIIQSTANIEPTILNNIQPFATAMNQNPNDRLPLSNTAIDTQSVGIAPQIRGNITQLIQPRSNSITFNSNDANRYTDCDPAQQNNCDPPSVMFGNTAELSIGPEAIIEITTTTTQRPSPGAANANSLLMANNGNAVSEIRSGANVVRSNLMPNSANRIVVSKPLVDLGAKNVLDAVPMWPMASRAAGLDKVDRLLSVSIDGKAIL